MITYNIYINDTFIKINSMKNISPTIPHANITDHYPMILDIKSRCLAKS